MDAAVFGGTVNFDIREAKETSTGAPLVSLLAQGGYTILLIRITITSLSSA